MKEIVNNINNKLDSIYNIINNIYNILNSSSNTLNSIYKHKATTTDNNSIGVLCSLSVDNSHNTHRCKAPAVGSKRKFAELDENVNNIFLFYRHLFSEHAPSLTAPRKRIIKKCVRDYGVDACYKAIYHLRLSPWHNGDNPEGRKWLEIDQVFDDKYLKVPRFSEKLDLNIKRGVPDAVRYTDCLAEFHASRAATVSVTTAEGSKGSDGHGQALQVADSTELGGVPVLPGAEVNPMDGVQRGSGCGEVEDVQHQ